MNPICGAKAKGTNKPCQRYPCKNGRCRLHGGKSTGAKTEDGKLRQKMASWKHGHYSQEAIEERRQVREFMKQCKEALV